MNMENEIFKKTNVDFNKLEDYGFKKENDNYIYSKTFMNESFRADITINKNGEVFGKIYDLKVDDEYSNFRVETNNGSFVSKVREEYKDILKDIRKKCFNKDYFISPQANRITKYIIKKYGDEPEFLWEKFSGYGVFRNKNNDKWYGIIMNIDKSKITNGSGEIEIIDIKSDEKTIQSFIKKKGYYEGYHMNKKSWLTIILDDTLSDEEIIKFIDESYNAVIEPTEWIVPANPKYYDIINCFNDTDTITWKQSSAINVSDIIYIYVAVPYSSILYKCEAIEVNIPYEYKDENLSITNVMKIKLLKKFAQDKITFSKLNQLGINAIRGPRKITKEVSKSFE